MFDRGRASQVLSLAAFVFAASGLSGCSEDDDCATTPEHVTDAYATVESDVQEMISDALVRNGFDVLVVDPGPDDPAPDGGVQQVAEALQDEGVDPSEIAVGDFGFAFDTTADRRRMVRELTSQEPLASQVAALMEQVEVRVTDAAERLPLPNDDMIEWRDELERDLHDAVRQALVGDPTYRAGIEAVLPDWDGSPSTALDSHHTMADTVLGVEATITDEVQRELVALCGDA